jgi:hypothetical protein
METNRPVWATLAACVAGLGVTVLIYKAAERSEVCWWTDPIFWIGVAGITMGASIFALLLLPPHVKSRRARRARREQALEEGRANQAQGLHEIRYELQAVSRQLKRELRWGERGDLFPNTAWTKNHHLVVGDAHTVLNSVYEQVHLRDQGRLAATQTQLTEDETQARREAKEAVDSAIQLVHALRKEFAP